MSKVRKAATTRNTSTRVLGPAVRALREARDIRHGVFAVECDMSPGFLTRIEQGVKQPSPEKARVIAERLGVPLEAIQYDLPERVCDCKGKAS